MLFLSWSYNDLMTNKNYSEAPELSFSYNALR